MSEMQGYARGWFVVAWAAELPPGEVRPLRYFGGHQVLFRTESGAVQMLDAHCPHLGAHLGHGGGVTGDEAILRSEETPWRRVVKLDAQLSGQSRPGLSERHLHHAHIARLNVGRPADP